jgi:hypothetical protein
MRWLFATRLRDGKVIVYWPGAIAQVTIYVAFLVLVTLLVDVTWYRGREDIAFEKVLTNLPLALIPACIWVATMVISARAHWRRSSGTSDRSVN